MDIIERLNEYLDAIDDAIAEIEMLRNALKLAAEKIELLTGSCPQDTDGWYREDGDLSCEDICKQDIEKECWKLFFEESTKSELDDPADEYLPGESYQDFFGD